MISPSDPCSAWAAKANKRVQFGYGINHLIEFENAIIVDVEPTPARTYDEVEATNPTLDLLRYRASKFDCDVCALKMQCCPNMPARQIPRDLQEDARNVARGLMCTKAFLKSREALKRVSPEDPSRLRTHAEAFLVHGTNSTWPLSCKASKPWPSEP